MKVRRRRPIAALGLGGALALGGELTMAVTSSAAGQVVPCRYDVEVVPQVNCGFFQGAMHPTAITSNGTIIGWASSCGQTFHDRSYMWNGGPTLTVLPFPPGLVGFHAWDMNDNGLIAGSGLDSNGIFYPYLYDSNTGTWQPVPQTAQDDWVGFVNNGGIAAGTRMLDASGSSKNAYVFNSLTGVLTDLGVMNGPYSRAYDLTEGSGVSGNTGPPQQLSTKTRGFLWRDGKAIILSPVPGGSSSTVTALNDAGQALVMGNVPHPLPEVVQRVFYWQDGRMEELPTLPGYDRSASSAIAPSGLAAGECNTVPATGWKGVVWQSGQVHDLNVLIDPIPGLAVRSASEMNAIGQIAAHGRLNNQNVVLRLTPRPRVLGDLNCDEVVNVNDLLGVINSWGPCGACPPDFNQDGVVNHLDLLIVIQNWG